MSVKIMLGVILAALFITMPAFAQEHGSKSAIDIIAKLKTQLNLTDDQVTAISPIIEKYGSKRKELRKSVQDGTLDKGDMHAQIEQLREDENQELSQILNQDQMSQWSNMQNHARHQYGASAGSSSETGQ